MAANNGSGSISQNACDSPDYFPPLDECFSRQHILFSWEHIYCILSDLLEIHAGRDSSQLVQFTEDLEELRGTLSSEKLHHFLTRVGTAEIAGKPWTAFTPPDSVSRAAFEKKTAAVNVTPPADGKYKLAEIKEDALYLSEMADIDEISALRVVVQEVQSRARNELLLGMREEEVASLNHIMGPSSNLSMSAQILSFTKSDEQYKAFSSKEARRDRIARTYLSEREYLLKTSALLYELGCQHSKLLQQPGEPKKQSVVTLLGFFMFNGYVDGDEEAFILRLLDSLESTLKELSNDKFQPEDQDIGEFYAKSIMNKAVSYMEILFRLLDATIKIPSANIILRWFRMLVPYGFLDNFSSNHESLLQIGDYMKCLVAVISVAMLKIDNSFAFMEAAPRALASKSESSHPNFLMDHDAICEIHNILNECAELRLLTMSPAIFTWSLLLDNMQMNVESYEAEEDADSEDSGTENGDSASTIPPLGSSLSRHMTPQMTRYKEVLEEIFHSSDHENPIIFLASRAVLPVTDDPEEAGFGGSLLFDFLTALGPLLGKYDRDGPPGSLSAGMRATLLEMFGHALPTVIYSPAVVNASLALLSGGQEYWDLAKPPKLAHTEDLATQFIRNQWLMTNLFDVSARRQPYERVPFLKFALALAASRAADADGNPIGGHLLDQREAFTHSLRPDFREFEISSKEDNVNLIVSTEPLHIFAARRARFFKDQGLYDQFIIPVGTDGRMVSETEPRVVVWFHSYSGYAYLGKLLETQLGNADTIEAMSDPIGDEAVAVIIDMFATLLLSCNKLDNPQQAAQHILEKASEGLGRTQDIINVIFDLFEHDLGIRTGNAGLHNFLGISISSLHFLYALVQIKPGRVWPFLARSGYLGVDGRGSRLSDIVNGTEFVTGHFDFLLSSIHLFDALVEDSVSHAVSRKAGSTSLVRYGSTQDFSSGVSDQGLVGVITQFTRLFIDVFRSAHTWKYQVPDEQLQLYQLIGSVFSNIMRYVYGIKDFSEPKSVSKLADPLIEAAQRIVDCFLSTAIDNPHVQVILHVLIEGFSQINYAFEPSLLAFHRHIATNLRLTITLLRLRPILQLAPSELEKQLFNAVPVLVRLYAYHESYKPLVLSVLRELIIGASGNVGEPTSIIGHLRPETIKCFLTMLSEINKSAESDGQVTLIWDFFSAVVSNRQRTLAIILLTGKTPREALKGKDASNLIDKPFLSVALDTLPTLSFDLVRSRLDPLPPAIAMLDFVAKAQDFWPSLMGTLQKHPTFIDSISTWVENLSPPALNRADEGQLLMWCYHLQMASSIAEILAMYLFRCREDGDLSSVKKLIPRLRFFKDHAVTSLSYNTSLHVNLKRNFESIYSGLNPLIFQKTSLGRRIMGANYFYDLVLSNKMLKYNQAWEGRKDDGIFTEFVRANINLSVVDAQIALLFGWKFLVIELRNSVPQEPDLQRLFAKITSECLLSNRQEQPPENIFARLTQTRADFALMAMQTLLDTQAKRMLAPGVVPAVQNILERVWLSVQKLRENVKIFSATDIQHYRSLLKLLYLALQVYAPLTDGANASGTATETKASVAKEIMIALEVTNHVVARGFRELAIAIHDRPAERSPEDVFLLTNILSACLRIPNIVLYHEQIMNHLINNEVARVAVTLFSWSDRLAVDGDPIYGELSIGFLLELSKIKAMAEQFAIDGVLGQISSAGLFNHLRQGNVSPFAEGAGPQRCYDIWVRGILPLLLNLLYSVGTLIGVEVAIFLNQFTPLLRNSLKGLEPNSSESNGSTRAMSGIVLKPVISRVVSEISALALIHRILQDYRVALTGMTEIPAVPGLAGLDGPRVPENADFWLSSRQLLRERIMPMGSKEAEWARQAAVSPAHACENRLEERIVEELMGIRDILGPVIGDVEA